MPRVTASVDEEDEEYLRNNSGDSTEYDSMSELMRDCITAHNERTQLREEIDRLEDRLASRENRIE